MKRFACGDVIVGCTWVMQLSDEAELLDQIARHVAAAHGVTTVDSDLLAVVQEHIQLVG